MPLCYHNGDAFGFIYNGEEYYYIKNVQNDIVAIADKNGTVVANYYYDALIGGVAGGGYGYNKTVKSNIPKGQRWRYVVGCSLVGAVIGGAIGGLVRYGVGVALGAKTSSGLVIKSVSRSLSSVSRNTIHHIMQSKHA